VLAETVQSDLFDDTVFKELIDTAVVSGGKTTFNFKCGITVESPLK